MGVEGLSQAPDVRPPAGHGPDEDRTTTTSGRAGRTWPRAAGLSSSEHGPSTFLQHPSVTVRPARNSPAITNNEKNEKDDTMTSTWISGRVRRSAAAALVVALVVAGLLVELSPGEAQADPPPIAVTPLTGRAAFTDDVALQIRNRFDGRSTDVFNLRDASRVVVAEVVIQPGATFPWHTHPGPVLITVVEGEFTYVLADDCVRREYAEGEALVDGGVKVHTAFNPGEVETVVIATFFDTPDVGALTIPVGPDQMTALNDKCGM